MSDNKAAYTFIWEIENLNFYFHDYECLKSPVFAVDILENTRWSLFLYVYSSEKNQINLSLSREESLTGPKEITMDYELSLISTDGSSLKTWNVRQWKFEEDDCDEYPSVSYDEVIRGKKDNIFFQETVTIRCRMWRSGTEFENGGICFARTQIGFAKRVFTWVLNRFDTLQPYERRNVRVQWTSKRIPSLNLSLYLTNDNRIEIEMSSSDANKLFWLLCKLSVIDNEGKLVMAEIKEYKFRAKSKEVYLFSTIITKKELSAKKKLYLPNNALSIRCECAISVGDVWSEIEDYSLYCDKSTNAIIVGINEDGSDIGDLVEADLKRNLQKLFFDKNFCDINIEAGGKTFFVHKVILSARSSVFKAMFLSKTEEMKNHCVKISDLDGDTMRQLLNFVYTDNVEDLRYESALKLYYAADKYEIMSLRRLCSDYLKVELNVSNSCEVLSLADLHQDIDLKEAVKEFMFRHDNEILLSEEWGVSEENNPKLACETVREMYLKMKGILI